MPIEPPEKAAEDKYLSQSQHTDMHILGIITWLMQAFAIEL